MSDTITTGRAAVITGAGSGIGAACARRLARRGWTVHGWDLKPADTPDPILWRTVDVADYGSVRDATAGLPSVDALINCAGIGLRGSADQLDPDGFARVMATNVNGTFHTGRALFPALAAVRGTVINIASIVAHRAGPGRAAYATSKAAILTLTQVQATDWGSAGVRVVAVSPGYVDTPMVQRSVADGGLDRDAITQRTPAGRLAEPDEIAAVIAALMEPTFALINGSAVVVDGGWLANGAY